ncbi:Spermidine/putrescine import ATP-binding protein PotA [Devosia equisanguinis]|uniref:Spermidine/putrescine import ATP-binding protein PotA n=1 Tax=Devosia equisanguinis TaxID=2490941 RepID=A0A3S4D3X0_9HYPH|nr:ABC transporter ATP-binding protein [Devosia equisanguinis]VDS03797.1 Spermidine/putrescine import ATP-binding protein PotA [Devosia equisanguinis]
MAYLTVNDGVKQFATFRALNGVSIAVERGEFFTLLGPSGCGKTTLLRAIAGFNDLSSGSIMLDGKDLRAIPPHKRDIGMVFQDYAVFPHLSVFDNVAFGLKPRKVPAEQIKTRVAEALSAVHLQALAERLPAAMSGGQQQRIGLARAMVINPQLLLMDEPLSNLDAKLRIELREEIRDIQKRVDIATIYVTHDQEEALAISDRICVMSAGHIEQIGTPQQIYGDPQTLFVANFVGTLNTLVAGEGLSRLLADLGLGRAAAHWTVRPERLSLVESGATAPVGAVVVSGTVNKFTYLGREAHVLVDTAAGPVVVQVSNPALGAVRNPGDTVSVLFERNALMAFDADGKRLSLEG